MNVAITGVGGGVGQAVIRSLRRSGFPLTLIGLDADPWSAGLYQCDRSAVIPTASEAGYAEALERVIIAHEVDVLIPGTDPELLPVAQFEERCRALGCTAITSRPSFVRVARDKCLSHTKLSAAGLPFVKTLTVSDFLASPGPRAFPAILKPRNGSASVGTKVLFSPEDIPARCLSEDYVVQDYLSPARWGIDTPAPGDVMKQGHLRQEDEISIQGLVSPDGTVVSIFASINELRDGVPVKIVPTLDPELHDFAERAFTICSRLGHVGPVNIQGRKTHAGLVLYEVNPRFTGITAVRAAMGFNECEAALRLFALGERPQDVAPDLRYTEDTVCLRYVTEEMVARSQVQVLA